MLMSRVYAKPCPVSEIGTGLQVCTYLWLGFSAANPLLAEGAYAISKKLRGRRRTFPITFITVIRVLTYFKYPFA